MSMTTNPPRLDCQLEVQSCLGLRARLQVTSRSARLFDQAAAVGERDDAATDGCPFLGPASFNQFTDNRMSLTSHEPREEMTSSASRPAMVLVNSGFSPRG